MHKAGFVNIVGNPNVGKSTLMNQLIGERISIATFKAQTTRHRIMGTSTPTMRRLFFLTPRACLSPTISFRSRCSPSLSRLCKMPTCCST